MRLAIIGRSIPASRQLVAAIMDQWRPEHLVIINRTGLAKVAAVHADEHHVPITAFGTNDRVHGHMSLEVAAEQAATVGQPDLLLALAMGRQDHRVVAVFRRCKVKVLIGSWSFSGNANKIEWAKV